MQNTTRLSILKNTLLASLGLFTFGVGTYLTIRANIGVAPWEALNLGLVHTFGIQYGNASITVSFAVLAVDLLLREKIGIGMFLDAVLVGKTVDLMDFLDLVPLQTKLGFSILTMLAGLTVMGFSQYLYMKAALGCGPRDSMLVGLKRHAGKCPIGVISIAILAAVTLAGWLLGGQIGIGTLLAAGTEGLIMQTAFRIVRFDPTAVSHQSLPDSIRVLFGKKA